MKHPELWAVLVLVLIAIGGLIVMYLRDSRYLHKKTKEALSDSLREEIEYEVEETKRKHEKFEATLKHFEK